MPHARSGELMVDESPSGDLERGLRTLAAEELDRLAGVWRMGDVGAELCFRHNPRLRAALGRFLPESRCIEVNPRAWRALSPEGMRELLVHEIAHAVVVSSKPSAKPHGVEWKELMLQAGISPSSRFSRSCHPVSHDIQPEAPKKSALTEHRCPVCHAVVFSRRRVTRWRCAACVAAGLEGRFLVTAVGVGTR